MNSEIRTYVLLPAFTIQEQTFSCQENTYPQIFLSDQNKKVERKFFLPLHSKNFLALHSFITNLNYPSPRSASQTSQPFGMSQGLANAWHEESVFFRA